MATTLYGDSAVTGVYSANVDEDWRVIKQLERRACDLQNEIWKLEERWQKRVDTMEKRQGPFKLKVGYDFSDSYGC